jgi:hypothetical protein
MKSTPKVVLTDSTSKQLIAVTASNFTCGYYGRYSANTDAPMIYEPYIDNARFGVKLLTNSTKKNGEPYFSQEKMDKFENLSSTLASSMRTDLGNASFNEEDIINNTGMSPIELMLKGLSILILDKSIHNAPKDCSAVSAMTRLVFDKYVPYN